MVSKRVEKFCKDYTRIENYDKAMADSKVIWECHHRLELEATGGVVDSTTQDLKDWGLYYNRPADELIFLKPSDHRKLHLSSKLGRTQRLNFTMKSKQHSEETKDKIAKAHSGVRLSESHKDALRNAERHWKVKHWKLVDGVRVWY